MTLNLWFLEVATLFCFDNCFTNTLHSVYKFHQIITRYVFPAFLQQFPEMYGTGGLFRFRSSVQFRSPIPALSDWDPLTGEARSLFWDIGNFPFHQIFVAQIWCMFWVVIFLEKEGSPNQPWTWWNCVSLQYSVIATLVLDTMNLKQFANSFTSRTSPGHDTASPMFDSGNNTCRTHTLVLSESHKHSLVWSKYFEFGLVHKTDFHSSNFQFLCFFAQASLFFLFITLSSGLFAAIRPFCPALVNLHWTVNLETSV